MNDDYRYDLLPHLIQKCGSRLEHLSLAKIGGCVVDAIAKHCKSLRHLKLSFESQYSFGLVESSWKGQGLEAKLQHLEIQTTWFDLGFFFRAVSLHCPNISHLSIDSTGREYKSIEDFCTSFGPTVLDLRLGNGLIENAVLKKICETCPNAVINCVQDYNYGMLSDKALALGTFAACWEVSSRDADCDDSLFSQFGMACLNLQRCSVTSYANAVSVNSFSNLFLLPKPKLKHIQLHVTKISSVSTVLTVLIAKGCLLEEFSYKGPCPPLELLQHFVVSQTESLKVVFAGGHQCICQDGAENDEAQSVRATSRNLGMFWIPIVTALLKNRGLTEISCRCSKSGEPRRLTEVAEACNPA